MSECGCIDKIYTNGCGCVVHNYSKGEECNKHNYKFCNGYMEKDNCEQCSNAIAYSVNRERSYPKVEWRSKKYFKKIDYSKYMIESDDEN